MPVFEVTSPDGRKFEVTAPDGASQDDVLRYAQEQFKAKPKPRELNRAAMDPEASTPFGTIKGETSSGFNPAAALIKAGHLTQRINQGILQAKLAPGEMLRKALGMGPTQLATLNDGAANDPADAQAIKDLQEVHPGSTTIGDLAVASAAPVKMLPAIAASEYGDVKERALRGGAALAGTAAVSGAAKLAAKSREQAAQKAAAAIEANKATAPFRDAGLSMSPATVNPTLTNRALEGLSGGSKTEQALSAKNAPVIDRLINEEVGLRGNASTKALEAIRKQEGRAYADIASFTYKTDDAFKAEVASLRPSISDELPELANPKIENLVKALSKDEFSGKTAVELSKRLRYEANKNFKNFGDPEKLELARAQRDAAEAVEALITRNLAASGQEAKAMAWEAARTRIAKTYQAEQALNEATGHYAAKEFAKMSGKKPLGGNFKTVADFANTFPKSAQTIDSATKANPFSVVDAMVSGIGAAGSGNPLFMAGMFARPALRSVITSKPYQQLMTRQSEEMPGLLMSKALDSEMAPLIAGLLSYQAAR